MDCKLTKLSSVLCSFYQHNSDRQIMDKHEKKYRRLEELDEEGVVTLLERWDLEEFVEFARERRLDGWKLFVSIILSNHNRL